MLQDACPTNNDNGVVCGNNAEGSSAESSLGSDEPDSSDDEHVTVRKKLRAFKQSVVDNGFGLGLEDKGASKRHAEVGGSSRGNESGSDTGYHSEYPNSGEDPETPESSSEDDIEVKKRKKNKGCYL